MHDRRIVRDRLVLPEAKMLAERANVSPRKIHAIEKGQQCRQAKKSRIITEIVVPWEMRRDYFPEPRTVRAVPRTAASVREVQSA